MFVKSLKRLQTLILEICALITILMGVCLVFIGWRLLQGPIDISFMQRDVERALTRVNNGRAVDIEKLTIEWSRERNRLEIAAYSVYAAHERSFDNFYINQIAVEFQTSSLLLGKLEPEAILLIGGELTVQRLNDGQWQLAGNDVEMFYNTNTPEAGEWLDQLNQSVRQGLQALNTTLAQNQIERIAIEKFQVNIIDNLTHINWHGHEFNLRVARKNTQIILDSQIAFDDPTAPEYVHIRAVTSTNDSSALIDVDVENWNLGRLSTHLLTDNIIAGDSTIGLNLSLAGDAEKGLSYLTSDISLAEGQISIIGKNFPVMPTKLQTTLDFQTGDLNIIGEHLAIGPVTGQIALNIPNALHIIYGAQHQNLELNLEAQSLQLDFANIVERAWNLSNVNLHSHLNIDKGELKVEHLKFDMLGTHLTGDGKIYWHAHNAGTPGNLPFGFVLDAQMPGPLPLEYILDFWPIELGSGGRLWYKNAIKSGMAADIQVKLDIKPNALHDGGLSNEALVLQSNIADAAMQVLSDLPVINKINGQLTLYGNMLYGQVNHAEMEEWITQSGHVRLTTLRSETGELEIDIFGAGPADNLLDILNRTRLNLGEIYEIDVTKISGTGEGRFKLIRPLHDNQTYEDLRYLAIGEFENVFIPDVFYDLPLEGTNVTVDVNENRVLAEGRGNLGPSPVTFTWDQPLKNTGLKSQITAEGFINPDMFNQFGIPVRAYISDDIQIKIEMSGEGPRIVKADIKMDLTPSEINIAELGWTKAAGEQADLHAVYFLDENAHTFWDLEIDHKEVGFNGQIHINDMSRLEDLRITRANVGDVLDVSGVMSRHPENGWLLGIEGSKLDISPILGETSLIGSETGKALIRLTLDAKITELVLRPGLTLSNARLNALITPDKIENIQIGGYTENGEQLSINFDGREQSEYLDLKASDAGFLFSSVFGEKFVEDGTLTLKGYLGSDGKLALNAKDVRLKRAPLLTQILSLASLKGLTDILAGDGILFSNLNADIILMEERYIIDGVSASGPALGFTANGWITKDGNALHLDGVLVPSFGVNSLLGGVPIFGDLFVSRDGEGVFAINYSIRGSLDRARVSINPFSAITPGVLRRIFDNPNDTISFDRLNVRNNIPSGTDDPPEDFEQFLEDTPYSDPALKNKPDEISTSEANRPDQE